MGQVVSLSDRLQAAQEWRMNSSRKMGDDAAARLFRGFKASFPPWNYDAERQQEMTTTYITVFRSAPLNAVEKAVADFKSGAVERGNHSFLPSPAEFGAYLKGWRAWVIEPPEHLDKAKIMTALSCSEKQDQIEDKS